MTPGTARTDKTRVRWGEEDQRKDDVSGGGSYTHMTLLSYNNEGMRNLFRASSHRLAGLGLRQMPRLDRDLLNTYSQGPDRHHRLPVRRSPDQAAAGPVHEAKQAAAEFRDIFGKENYFCELMDHGLDIERRVTADLLRLAKELNSRWWPPTTCTTRTSTTPRRTRPCWPSSPVPPCWSPPTTTAAPASPSPAAATT